MPLKIFDTKEAAPEALRASAVELKDGKWAVDEPAPELGDKGEAALQRERDARKLEKKRADDAEAERDTLKRTAEAKARGISEEELQKIRDAEASARKPLVDELEATKAENRRLKLTDRVKALALTAGVMPDRIAQAMKILDGRTDLTDAGGIVVKDEAGTVTTETIDDFLSKTFKKESPWFYSGTGASGSGGSGGSGGQKDDQKEPSSAEKERLADRARMVAGGF